MDYALPVGIAVFAWWSSTIVVMYRAGLPEGSYIATLAGATAALGAGLAALAGSVSTDGVAGVYLGFFAGLLIWAWHEVSYLFGFISGPQTEPCPPDVRGWQRFVLGVRTCVYHELLIVATAAMLAVVTWNGANRIALWTFCILWLMRWSVKLNIFLGVRNLHFEYLPPHLGYLSTFVRKRSMNELFPLSMIISVAAFLLLVAAASAAPATSAAGVGATLLATLLALAIFEHGLLVVNLDDGFLWRLGLRSRGDGGAAPG